MQTKQVNYHEWKDIEQAVRDRITFTEPDSTYLWRLFLKYFKPMPNNRSIEPIFMVDTAEEKINALLIENESHIEFIRVIEKIWQEYSIKYVRFYW